MANCLCANQIVPRESAILPAYTSIGIHADHKQMTKFSSAADPGFLNLKGEINRWTKDILNDRSLLNRYVSSLQNADRSKGLQLRVVCSSDNLGCSPSKRCRSRKAQSGNRLERIAQDPQT